MPPSRRQHQPLNRQSATGAHERVEIEVPVQKLELTNVDAFYQLTLSASPKPVGGIVATWSVEEWPRLPLAYRT
jgi:hypothetical protein